MKRIILVALCAVFTFSLAYAQDGKKKSNKETLTFKVEGMDCANCVKKIEKNIAFAKGVTDLKCDLPTRTAEVTYRSDKTSEAKLKEAFKKIGMEAKTLKEGEEVQKHEGHDHSGHDHAGHKH
ncbi:cation transporter [Parabacteroides sp. 52]|uniref:heavy-metal-associated domain-containing protein n=1 Tax=unclassified Parabacteroides TaxID=2649774 RepID=UPI0013CF7EC3|nr:MULTISPECIES: heavy-metal-associated domain-containing protein [unclassified Parabacteroides]MDH6533718.1 mercuric ion binding protein [Parabacteroides sp. PM5-20]NDV54470.1 cation transporter [Parabacteroides sp. 52]